MTPEGKVKKLLVEGLEQLGAYWFFPATHGYGRSGVPDVVACIDGKFWAFECKAGKNQLTKLQKAELRKILQAKGIGTVVYGKFDVENVLQFVEEETGRKRDEQLGRRNAQKSRRSQARPRLRAE